MLLAAIVWYAGILLASFLFAVAASYLLGTLAGYIQSNGAGVPAHIVYLRAFKAALFTTAGIGLLTLADQFSKVLS